MINEIILVAALVGAIVGRFIAYIVYKAQDRRYEKAKKSGKS